MESGLFPFVSMRALVEQKVLIENVLRSKGLWMLEYRRYIGAKTGASPIGQALNYIKKLIIIKLI